MDKSIKFRRNVYIILICILLFAIVSQIARSSLILKFTTNNKFVERTEWIEMMNQAQSTKTVSSSSDNHCIVTDSEDSLSNEMEDNFAEVYRYIKQPYTIQDVGKETITMSSCSAVIMISSLEKMGDYIEDIEHYVDNGGHFFLARMDHPGNVLTQIYRKLGINNYWFVIGNTDVRFTSNLLIGQKDVVFEDDYFYNDSLSLELDSASKLLATGKDQTPLIWEVDYGEGSFMVYNGNNLGMKANRGLVVGCISLMIPNYIYPVFNSKIFYIDDYPAPMSQEINVQLYNEYRKNIAAFFKDIWWPDMIKAARKYDLKYTAVAIQDYNDDVTYPFGSMHKDDFTNLIVYGREVLKSGGEIGIHGYNHQPLQFRKDIADFYEYKKWESIDDIEASIEEVVEYMAQAFPNYSPVSYVPPSNIISEEGRKALVEKWPDFRVISSLYEEDPLDYAYVQEYEIASDGIIEMPRVTSGYADAADTKWLEANVMTSLGIISHFIHPDDIFDTHRSGDKNWSQLYEGFESMLHRMEVTYPWLRAQTSSEAALSMGYVLSSQITRNTSDNQVEVSITNQAVTQYFILRTEKKIGKLVDCNVNKIDENTYLVTADSEHFTIELK
ncbi:MAG TPA: DUF2194 domain-containing protein [Candidatus Paenibacillus intestinavium]|nr:DUF2194 domain-containing protein [Candidatus Paenibacillus intestinavium]